MSKLKPCPFCGSEAELTIYYDFYRFHCPDPECEAHLPDGVVVNGIGNWHPSIPDAKDAWNTRAERTCHLSKVTSWDDDGHNTWGVICSACDAHIEHDTGYGIRYCPKCGARVVK